MAKENLNPVTVAEQGIAEYLRELPEIAGLFSGEKAIPVYAASDESALVIIDGRIKRAVGQSVMVAFAGFSEVLHAQIPRKNIETLGNAAFNIDVYSPGILSSQKIKSSSDLAFAVVNAIDGLLFAEPFKSSLQFRSWMHEDRNGTFVVSLNFTTTLKIK